MSLRLSLTAAVAWLVFSPAAFAQGISEYGSLLGAQGKPSGSLVNSLTQTYDTAAKKAATVNSPTVSSISHIRPTVSAEDAVSYGKRANDCYLAAQSSLKSGNCHEAIRQYSNALLIRQRIWGDGDPAVAQMLLQQADLYRKNGQLHDCENNYRRLLAINVKRYGPGSKELDKTLYSLADLCERQCDTTDALSFYQQLVAIRQRYELPDSACLKNARLKLANTLTVTCDYPAAEQILTDVIAHEDASPSPDTEYLCRALDCYGGLLRETFRKDEAEKIEARQRQLLATLHTKKPCNGATTAVRPATADAANADANTPVLPATTSPGPATNSSGSEPVPASTPSTLPASTPAGAPAGVPSAFASPASTPTASSPAPEPAIPAAVNSPRAKAQL